MTALAFSKMHGAGNDFVVIDLRGGRPAPAVREVRAMGDRHRGIGFDQLLTLDDPPAGSDAVASYRIWNADGTEAGQCGNGARCVAHWLHREGAARGARFAIHGPPGRIEVEVLADGDYALAMGVPALDVARIPFLPAAGDDGAAVEHALALPDGRVLRAGLVSMGNPHAVIEVDDVAAFDLDRVGPWLQAMPAFPASVNVGAAQVLGPDAIALRVFERGAGETLACGSGACAAVVALVRRGRLGRGEVAVRLPGGTLRITWPRDDAPVRMAGPAAFVFHGEWTA